jgi:hypothetical protein
MLTVDTLKAYEDLVAAAMPEEQARVLVNMVNHLQEARLADLPTRPELKELMALQRAEFKEDIASLRAEFKGDIAEVKASLIRWMFAFFIGQAAFIVALVKVLK